MRLITLNLKWGGRDREDRLIEALTRLEADVAVLTEYQPGQTGDRILDGLAEAGLSNAVATTSRNRKTWNAVAIASRAPIASSREPVPSERNGHRVLEATIGELTVIGAYFPQDDKAAYWRDEFIPFARASLEGDVVILGDLNTGSHFIDEPRAEFTGAESFDQLSAMGWTDAWRSLHPDTREFSWYSDAGNGFRLDHAFLSPTLAPSLGTARYVHETRDPLVTDHSALLVELAR